MLYFDLDSIPKKINQNFIIHDESYVKNHFVKIYVSNNESNIDYHRELKFLKLINNKSRHVISLFDLKLNIELNYIVLPYYNYCLFDIIVDYHTSIINNRSSRKSLSNNSTRILSTKIIKGITFLHKLGIIHNDLKLENIMVDSININDKQLSLKIIDFNLSMYKKENKDISKKYYNAGTFTTCSPEKFRKRLSKDIIDEKTDIFSFGCVVYSIKYGLSIYKSFSLNKTIFVSPDRDETKYKVRSNIVKFILEKIENKIDRSRVYKILYHSLQVLPENRKTAIEIKTILKNKKSEKKTKKKI